MTDPGLRLLVFDRTCRGSSVLPGLSHAWSLGSVLYRGLGRLDAVHGAATWEEALDWLGTERGEAPIAEVQFWGHGKWGHARIDEQVLDRRVLERGHPLHERLRRVRDRLVPSGSALFWFRTCETFGARVGHDFARAWTDWLGCRAAGHTHVIGYWQSGLHSLGPGAEPDWDAAEGLAEGNADTPVRARWSMPGAPNTITCLEGRIPEGF